MKSQTFAPHQSLIRWATRAWAAMPDEALSPQSPMETIFKPAHQQDWYIKTRYMHWTKNGWFPRGAKRRDCTPPRYWGCFIDISDPKLLVLHPMFPNPVSVPMHETNNVGQLSEGICPETVVFNVEDLI